MIKLTELQSYLDALLQNKLFQDYCPNGLQVEGSPTIKNLAVGISASLETIQKAVKLKCQALIVHHGIFWTKEPFVATGIRREKLKNLLSHEISLFAYHLPLDAHPLYGNNWKAAKDLGWTHLEPFPAMPGVPIGVKGSFPEIKVKEFQKQLEKYYKHPAHTALGGKEKISSAALISGGAHKNIADAIAVGIDCFITGSFDEPIWHQAYEGNINFFALGHAATEKVGPYALGRHLEDKFKLKVHFIEDLNPF